MTTPTAKELDTDAATLAKVLAHPKCPAASKFHKRVNYLAKLKRMAARLTPAGAPANEPAPASAPARPRMRRKAKGKAAIGTAYDKHKETMRNRGAAQSKEGRDIAGRISDTPADIAKRGKASDSLQYFLERYFPHKFFSAWSADHIKVIDRMQDAILHGGNSALAMPRGNGKTSIVECAAIWAIVNGFHDFVMIVGADGPAAEEILSSIKAELDTNDLLFADYPLEVGPFRMLEGVAARANGQIYNGERTRVKFNNKEVRFGNVEGSKANGALVRVAGITGRIRGHKYKSKRPTLALVDDPQTDESAKSETQSAARLKIIRKAIMGLAGPGQSISILVPCTIIEKGDTASRLLDREHAPEFHGILTKMIYKMPDATEKWDEYLTVRLSDLADGNDQLPKATKFYKKNRKEMDAGAHVAWDERKLEWEVSALQHVFDLRAEVGEDAFMSEYQNAPRSADDDPDNLSIPRVLQVNGRSRSIIPEKYTRIVIGVDVQDKYACYEVLAVTDDFDVATIEYGTYPDQGREFTRRTPRCSWDDLNPKGGHESALLKGLTACFKAMLEREWTYEGGGTMQAEKILADSGYKKDIVQEAIKQAKGGNRIQPCMGRGIQAKDAPISEWKSKPGDRKGDHWRVARGTGATLRTVMIDTNHWKTFMYNRIHTQYPEKGAMVVYGKTANHELYFSHVAAEYGVKVESKGRTIYEWRMMPGVAENDFLDTTVYGMVAASMTGSKLNRGKPKPKPAPAKKRSTGNFATKGIGSGRGSSFAKGF